MSNQLGAGTAIHVVRDMAAHRSLSVTALYAHSTDEARRAASQRVQIAVLPARQPSWTWDASPEGERFLFILAVDDDAPVTLVTNWQSELKR